MYPNSDIKLLFRPKHLNSVCLCPLDPISQSLYLGRKFGEMLAHVNHSVAETNNPTTVFGDADGEV